MNLHDYYHGLPKASFPKKEFVLQIANSCNVDPYSVRNWIAGRVKPADPEHKEILSEFTGIPVDELW